jgi:hypothetical protein
MAAVLSVPEGPTMPTAIPFSRKALAAFLLSLLAPACVLFALISRTDLLLLAAILCGFLAFVLGAWGGIEITRSAGRFRGQTLALLGMLFPAAGAYFGVLFVPAVWGVQERTARSRVVSQFKQIAIALHCYIDAHDGRLPPAFLCDREGRPLLSWRVLILPYLNEQALYDEFHLDEPWDSPHNLALLPRLPQAYVPPSCLPVKPRIGPHSTFYQVFTGKGTAFEAPRGCTFTGASARVTRRPSCLSRRGKRSPGANRSIWCTRPTGPCRR